MPGDTRVSAPTLPIEARASDVGKAASSGTCGGASDARCAGRGGAGCAPRNGIAASSATPRSAKATGPATTAGRGSRIGPTGTTCAASVLGSTEARAPISSVSPGTERGPPARLRTSARAAATRGYAVVTARPLSTGARPRDAASATSGRNAFARLCAPRTGSGGVNRVSAGCAIGGTAATGEAPAAATTRGSGASGKDGRRADAASTLPGGETETSGSGRAGADPGSRTGAVGIAGTEPSAGPAFVTGPAASPRDPSTIARSSARSFGGSDISVGPGTSRCAGADGTVCATPMLGPPSARSRIAGFSAGCEGRDTWVRARGAAAESATGGWSGAAAIPASTTGGSSGITGSIAGPSTRTVDEVWRRAILGAGVASGTMSGATEAIASIVDFAESARGGSTAASSETAATGVAGAIEMGAGAGAAPDGAVGGGADAGAAVSG